MFNVTDATLAIHTPQNTTKIFNLGEFGDVRWRIADDGEPRFIANDIANPLGYKNVRDALRQHVDPRDKGVVICDTLGGQQRMTEINESGLYSLILASKLPAAKEFKHKVTSEMLPSIRKHGGYIAGQEKMTTAEILANALKLADSILAERDKRIAALAAQIERDKPKVEFADAISGAKNSVQVGVLARFLAQNGVMLYGRLVSRNALFQWFRENINLPIKSCSL